MHRRPSSADSEWCAMVEDLADAGRPPARRRPRRTRAVPAILACRKMSPQRSTPGPLPNHRPKTPSTTARAVQVDLLAAPQRGGGEILVEAGLELDVGGLELFARLPHLLVDAAQGLLDQLPILSPAASSRAFCMRRTRTSAWMPPTSTCSSERSKRSVSETSWSMPFPRSRTVAAGLNISRKWPQTRRISREAKERPKMSRLAATANLTASQGFRDRGMAPGATT